MLYRPPVLPRMGGKTLLMGTLVPIIEYTISAYKLNGLADIFCGGGKIIPYMQNTYIPERWMNDKDKGVVSFFKCLQDVGLREKMLKEIVALQFEICNAETFKQACLDMLDSRTDTVRSGALAFIVSKYSRAGDLRKFMKVNSEKGISKGYLERFSELTPIFADVEITCEDYKMVMTKLNNRRDVLIVLDPPYVGSDIYQSAFNREEHIELMEVAMEGEALTLIFGTDNALYNRLITEGNFRKYYLGTISKSSSELIGSKQDEFVWCNFEIPSWLLPVQYVW